MLEAKALPIQELRAMAPEEISKLLKKGFDLQTKAKDSTEAHKGSVPAMGKLVFVEREHFDELKSDKDRDGNPKRRQIRADMEFPEYWRRTISEKTKLNNHWLSCAVTFEHYVVKDVITEADYDANTAECLELAASIGKLVKYDVTNENYLAAAHELRTRNNSKGDENSRNKLKAIIAALKGEDVMTKEEAETKLTEILAANPYFLTDVVIPAVSAEIAYIKDAAIAKDAFFGINSAGDMFARNVTETGERRFSDATMDSWLKPAMPEAPAVQHLRAGTPVPATP